ncbi:MAG: hypothetical protein M1822_010219 [Bathelium mastoideum]|nr:MAG: hypothetical protein M1822_010219 [Bathelium mastoideum]
MDVFVQQHPEYVSLAWGTFKLLFTGVVNHEELTKELAKALCQIADVLPQTERDILLYPSEPMKNLVATLYAKIICFSQRAIQWYTEGKIKHAVSAVIQPYNLRFKDLVSDVYDISQRIERLAHSMSRAELRSARLELQDNRKEITESRKEITENRKELRLLRNEHKDTQMALTELKALLERKSMNPFFVHMLRDDIRPSYFTVFRPTQYKPKAGPSPTVSGVDFHGFFKSANARGVPSAISSKKISAARNWPAKFHDSIYSQTSRLGGELRIIANYPMRIFNSEYQSH